MLFLYFCPFLDQQLNLCRQIPDFPHIGQIPGFSEPQVFTNPGLFPKSRVFQNPGFFHLNDVIGEIPVFFKNPNFTNPRFCRNLGFFTPLNPGFFKNPNFTNPRFCRNLGFFTPLNPGFFKNPNFTNPRFYTPNTIKRLIHSKIFKQKS